MSIILYSLASVLLISLMSFIGVLTFSLKAERLRGLLLYLVSFSAGALFGDAFLHLLPEATEAGFGLPAGTAVLTGIAVFFIIEKIINWRHCHFPPTHEHIHPFAWMNLFGDAVHNFIDGLIIGASYFASIPVGVATTIAVILHEIPQEIGDFGILLHGGFPRKKALLFNFVTALMAFIGLAVSLALASLNPSIGAFFIPFAAGGFIYIAGSDLIPELHKERKVSRSFWQFVALLFGIGVMMALLGAG